MRSDPKRIVCNRVVIWSPTFRVPANEHGNHWNQKANATIPSIREQTRTWSWDKAGKEQGEPRLSCFPRQEKVVPKYVGCLSRHLYGRRLEGISDQGEYCSNRGHWLTWISKKAAKRRISR